MYFNFLSKTGVTILLFGFAVIITAWAYWPGLLGPTLLDDRSSLSVVAELGDDSGLAIDRIFGDRSGALGRPVSMASFVIEKLYFDAGVAGQKRLNVILHLINGGLVAWMFWLLLRYIQVPYYRLIAVLSAAVWLVSPLYVSTVLYVVQRMAILSSLFMLCACISYIYWRLALISGKRGLLAIFLGLVFGSLALFSKENAIVLIPTLLLMETLWFEFKGVAGTTVQNLRLCVLALLAAGFLFLLLLFVIYFDSLLASFHNQYFSLSGRLLTESRVLWDYVGQLYWPSVKTMGLYHDDVVVSTSITEPLSTMYAVLAWFLVLVFSLFLLKWRRGRHLVFAISWFLFGHSVESTVLPLELYFEHRNYFPGIGLVLIIAVLLGTVAEKWKKVAPPLAAYLAVYILYLAFQMSSQVQIWSSHPLIIFSHLNAHPDSFRANIDMAVHMARIGELDAAKKYSKQAYEVSHSERIDDYAIRNLALSCMANKTVTSEDIDIVGTSGSVRPISSVTTLLIMVRLLQSDACPNFDTLRFADRLADMFLDSGAATTASANIYSSLAVLENSLGRYGNAYEYTALFLVLSPESVRALLMKLHFASALGMADVVKEVILNLQAVDKKQGLTVEQKQTLSLYLET